MPSQLEHAIPTKISELHRRLVGPKLRIAGRVLVYDAADALATLLDYDGRHTVSVDVSNALDDRSGEWASERLSTVIALGYLEEIYSEHPRTDDLPSGVEPPTAGIRFRAILVAPARDLDLMLWDAVVEDVQARAGEK
ncbi:hypothetical protein FA15DRAFT_667354 [Coprinopsis marcescibilis]|uniref:Uncharacterized protein n=1 Tax=Coprinopsis marcescibilis TaxID=230819 RepID=A0A5C3L0J4_COPMA|nr:hypothetical protein FA15DRAFT_667354 [Coprinopsis marcescibilis]